MKRSSQHSNVAIWYSFLLACIPPDSFHKVEGKLKNFEQHDHGNADVQTESSSEARNEAVILQNNNGRINMASNSVQIGGLLLPNICCFVQLIWRWASGSRRPPWQNPPWSRSLCRPRRDPSRSRSTCRSRYPEPAPPKQVDTGRRIVKKVLLSRISKIKICLRKTRMSR